LLDLKMDPFALLPPELSASILLFVEKDPLLRPRHLRASLLVSKRWNAVCMQPVLWRDLDFSVLPLGFAGMRPRVLERAQGGLRSLVLGQEASSSSLWDGAVQRGCAGGQLASFGGHSYLTCSLDRVMRMAETVSSPELRSLSLSVVGSLGTYTLVREILERSLH
jgi:hypothetical protein